MGTTDFGTQTIIFDYGQTGTAKGFNKLNYKLFPKGIYEGGLLTYVNANTVSVGSLTCFIEDSAIGLGTRIETTESVNKTIIEATPYVILRFVWADVASNYMDFFCKAEGDLLATDIILGKGDYVGGVLQNDFLYDERTISILTQSLGKFYYGDTDPTGTQRLNYDGYFYPTRVYNAMWGDLAEYFPKALNEKEVPGKIYSINNNNRVYQTFTKADKNVVGVCSDTAGFILHEKYKEIGICIGLSGTVNVLVNGPIKKGDFLVSDKKGYAKKATIFNKIFKPESIIGKALETKSYYLINRINMLIK